MFEQQVTFIYARDLEVSAQFYSEILELSLTLDQGKCKIFEVSPNAFLGVCACNDQRPSNPEGIIITLVSQNVDGWYEKLVAKGIEFDAPPSENPAFNIYHCFLRDPDGYQIEIQQFRDPAWPAPLR